MLHKPTNPSPYNSVLDPKDGISFKASCVNTNEISRMRLMVDDKSLQYFFPLAENTDYTFNNGEISINIAKNTAYGGYKISRSNYERNIVSQNIISDIIKAPKKYNWQVRLYQNVCDVNIAYGFIQEVFNDKSLPSPLYNSSANCVLKVRPHTNMFFNANIEGQDFNKGVKLKNLLSYYDNDVDYEIEINGMRYPVLAYYYSYGNESSTDNRALQKDSYDDPLFAYIEITTGETDVISDSDEYSIYTNYIDSNEFPFSCINDAELKLFDRHNSLIAAFVDGVDGLKVDGKGNSTRSIFEIDYSNFELNGIYAQDNGASVSYYRASLYQILDSGKERLIDDTGNVYKSKINYKYDDFLSGRLYKLVLQITDTNRKPIVKSIFIAPNYNTVIAPRGLNVQYYKEHGSILLDFDDLISISGHEKFQGECTFNSAEVDGTSFNFCSVHPDNIITYNKIDGSNQDIICHHPLLSMIFKCEDGDTQKIFELIDDDNNKYEMYWFGHYFDYRKHSPANNLNYDEWACYLPFESKGFSLLKPINEEEITNNTKTALQKVTADYSVPYYALDELPTVSENGQDTLRWHTESIAHDFWWQVIIKPNYFYIKCLNAPVGHTWEYEKR